MRNAALVVTAIALLLVDLVVLPFFAFGGVFGSMLFTFFALFALQDDVKDALMLGALTGFLQEIYFPYGFGMHLLTNIFLFLALSRIGETLKENRRLVSLTLVVLAQGTKHVVFLSVLFLFGVRGDFASVPTLMAYTAVLALLLYSRVRSFRNIPFIKKEWKF